MPIAFIAMPKAAVPLLTAIPYFLLTFLENSFSNRFTNGPFRAYPAGINTLN